MLLIDQMGIFQTLTPGVVGLPGQHWQFDVVERTLLAWPKVCKDMASISDWI